jgi:hypothetical protein
VKKTIHREIEQRKLRGEGKAKSGCTQASPFEALDELVDRMTTEADERAKAAEHVSLQSRDAQKEREQQQRELALKIRDAAKTNMVRQEGGGGARRRRSSCSAKTAVTPTSSAAETMYLRGGDVNRSEDEAVALLQQQLEQQLEQTKKKNELEAQKIKVEEQRAKQSDEMMKCMQQMITQHAQMIQHFTKT